MLIAGDDGVPVRVREELAGAGVDGVDLLVLGGAGRAGGDGGWGAGRDRGRERGDDVGGGGDPEARSVGILGPDDLENLSAALQVADEVPGTRIVVRLFSADLAEGVEAMLGGRGTVLSEIEVAAPALIQAALSGNEGQRVTVGRRILEVAEVDRDDPALVVALCDADTPTEVLPTRDALGRHVLGARRPRFGGQRRARALPASVAQFGAASRSGRSARRAATAPARR